MYSRRVGTALHPRTALHGLLAGAYQRRGLHGHASMVALKSAEQKNPLPRVRDRGFIGSDYKSERRNHRALVLLFDEGLPSSLCRALTSLLTASASLLSERVTRMLA